MSAKTQEIAIRKSTKAIKQVHEELKAELHPYCDHTEFTTEELAKYADIIEHCEDCDAPMIISCCNDELDPEPSMGGTCPTCGEHCL